MPQLQNQNGIHEAGAPLTEEVRWKHSTVLVLGSTVDASLTLPVVVGVPLVPSSFPPQFRARVPPKASGLPHFMLVHRPPCFLASRVILAHVVCSFFLFLGALTSNANS